MLRALPMLVWGWSSDACTRDECIYKIVSRPILAGEGLGLAPKGWLPAPGFPWLMAASHEVFGRFEAIKWVHWVLLVPTSACLWWLGHRLEGRRAARWLVALFAVHPTFVFYTGTMWTETVYTLLLVATFTALAWARDGGWRRALVPGLLLGLTVLNRGVATYLAPLIALALLAPDTVTAWKDWPDAARKRARHAVGFLLAVVLTVAPYSVHASRRWGGLVITDATLGHVMALGNNTYPPVTFDYGIGQLTGPLYAKTLHSGRPDCPRQLGPIEHDRCEVSRARAWILEHPAEFVARVPTRLAQLFNPHSFLTRHVRWGNWPGLPWALKELIVLYQHGTTLLIVLGGTLVAWGRARGPWALAATGTVLYHLAVISALYGLTRFRLPLEALWLVWVAVGLAQPRAVVEGLLSARWRLVGALVTLPMLGWLLHQYAWTGYPGFGP